MLPSRILEKGKGKIALSSNSEEGDDNESWEWEDIRNIPTGYRFEPDDEQLLTYYLKPKLEHNQLPPNFMHEIDLYRPGCPDVNPQCLTAKYAGHEEKWYFFTPRDRKYPNGKRPNRASGTGYWKATAAIRDIHRSTGNKELLGHRSSLVFYQGNPPGRKTNWLMQEFSVGNHLIRKTATPAVDRPNASWPPKRMKLDEWVLCIIYINERSENKQKKSREVNFSMNESEPVVQGDADHQGENHSGGSENHHNRNYQDHESGSSNADNIGYNNNTASQPPLDDWMMQWGFPNPSEGLILKDNYCTNDPGNDNMATSIGDIAAGAVQGSSFEGLGVNVPFPTQGGDDNAKQVVQEHHCGGAPVVAENFVCDDYPLDSVLSTEDCLEWLQDLGDEDDDPIIPRERKRGIVSDAIGTILTARGQNAIKHSVWKERKIMTAIQIPPSTEVGYTNLSQQTEQALMHLKQRSLTIKGLNGREETDKSACVHTKGVIMQRKSSTLPTVGVHNEEEQVEHIQ
ncbi:hypothetical protein Cgig2_018885 [Carnegiea gigantea]|uniref:NAC domain-containing protein n=1 Tax=Carnegiea gigantea TaxID=171969 RepID=A0A9Q1QEN7_9CARY|nr:hypothetical protein Cgig2_018885 [Carnegiea gigantea]